MDPSLAGVLQYIQVSPNDIPVPMFHVSSFGVHGDPVIDHIKEKLDKVYEFAGPRSSRK